MTQWYDSQCNAARLYAGAWHTVPSRGGRAGTSKSGLAGTSAALSAALASPMRHVQNQRKTPRRDEDGATSPLPMHQPHERVAMMDTDMQERHARNDALDQTLTNYEEP